MFIAYFIGLSVGRLGSLTGVYCILHFKIHLCFSGNGVGRKGKREQFILCIASFANVPSGFFQNGGSGGAVVDDALTIDRFVSNTVPGTDRVYRGTWCLNIILAVT
jgi:hypothetical protein